jgi:hypothetical protein
MPDYNNDEEKTRRLLEDNGVNFDTPKKKKKANWWQQALEFIANQRATQAENPELYDNSGKAYKNTQYSKMAASIGKARSK